MNAVEVTGVQTPRHPLSGRPVIVGAGLAGLMTALELAPTPCVLVTGGRLGVECASDWAQGGLAAAVGPDDDPELHALDTIGAGAGLCDPAVVRRITAAGPDAVRRLLALGARLDTQDGSLRLGLEGAHSRRRIVHSDGDGTGHELTRAAVEAVRRTPSITVLEDTFAVALVTGTSRPTKDHDRPDGTENDPITGIVVVGRTDDSTCPSTSAPLTLETHQVVLATGGLGALFSHTTNPRGSRGSGLALGLRAGAQVRDLEMVQFHPTALDVGLDPMPLVSEAVRGEGAHLVNDLGERVLADDLSPRDVVSRAVWSQLTAGRDVYLDARNAIGEQFPHHFPTVTAACRAAGIDPVTDLIPIRPAAHYHMGGLTVDGECRTTVPGLWAVGEVSSTGLHGANRLASNSLLEAVVCAGWAAASVDRSVRQRVRQDGQHPAVTLTSARPLEAATATTAAVPQTSRAGWSEETRSSTRRTLSFAAGVLRDRGTLTRGLRELRDGAGRDDARLVSLLICYAARLRAESRGGHTRTDYPAQGQPVHITFTLDQALADIDGRAHAERSAS